MTASDNILQKIYRRWKRKPRRGIKRTLPIELVLQGVVRSWIGSVRTPRNYQRLDAIDSICSDVDEPNATRSTHPFVTISNVISCIDLGNVELNHSRNVCAVDNGIDSSDCHCGHYFLDWKDQCCSTRDMVDQCEFCAISDAGHDTLKYFSLRSDRKRDLRNNYLCAISRSHKIEQHCD